MSNKEFYAQLTRKELIWDALVVLILTSVIVLTAIYSWSYLTPIHNIVQALLITFGVALVFLEVIKKVDHMLRLSLLKSYWIEDCGDVVKLHGSVRAVDIDSAYSDIFRVRSGLKIAENAYEKYGCTLAAIDASTSELEAKKAVESLGITVSTMN